jgi:hypothetical protein
VDRERRPRTESWRTMDRGQGDEEQVTKGMRSWPVRKVNQEWGFQGNKVY